MKVIAHIGTDIRLKLKEIFGYNSFRGNQEAIIKNVMDGRNNFVIMPTGAGKSLCYQLPAVVKDNIYIVSNQHYGSIIQEQLPAISDNQILLEPVRRNTAPCVAYASYKIYRKDPEAVIVVTPADHAIFWRGGIS